MTIDEMIKIMEIAEKYHLKSFRLGDCEIYFKDDPRDIPLIPKQDENVIKPEVKEQNIEEIIKALSIEPELTSEEILYYAVPYFDELQAQKLEKEKERETA